MKDTMTRRAMLAAAALGAAGTASAQAGDNAPENVLILGVSGSPRKGKTTATAMAAALEAAKGVDPRITTELIDLGGLKIAGSDGSSSSAPGGVADDFEQFLPLLKSQNLGGMMIGSPSYFRSMSSLCKAFLERLAVLRDPSLQLADLPVGALSVGSYRNGGQELVIEQILTVMLCHEAMLVGGKPKAHQGATLWNAHKDDITQDEFGMESARNLGIRVAEAALKHKGLK
ncbi:MAG: flavodoxin family protein [Candidatus Hydrogenedentes bacterium]|nr:flavodoxin family protein [Candidatus Hydrogenedentota bacterium]